MKDKSILEIEEAIAKGPTLQYERPTYDYKLLSRFPDDCIVNNTKITLRPKTFIEDKT